MQQAIHIILFATNTRLALVILPILPIAMILFMIFGAVARPMFEGVQRRLSTMNSILQENLAGACLSGHHHVLRGAAAQSQILKFGGSPA